MAGIPDEIFATGVFGQWLGILHTEGTIVAPFSGAITTVADSKHTVSKGTGAAVESRLS